VARVDQGIAVSAIRVAHAVAREDVGEEHGRGGAFCEVRVLEGGGDLRHARFGSNRNERVSAHPVVVEAGLRSLHSIDQHIDLARIERTRRRRRAQRLRSTSIGDAVGEEQQSREFGEGKRFITIAVRGRRREQRAPCSPAWLGQGESRAPRIGLPGAQRAAQGANPRAHSAEPRVPRGAVNPEGGLDGRLRCARTCDPPRRGAGGETQEASAIDRHEKNYRTSSRRASRARFASPPARETRRARGRRALRVGLPSPRGIYWQERNISQTWERLRHRLQCRE
jgi:hypothetical protein